MKKVLLFNVLGNKEPITISNYEIHSFDYNSYFTKRYNRTINDFIFWGLNGFNVNRSITSSSLWIDELYRRKDPLYISIVDDFVEMFKDFDLIVMSSFNFIHPDVFAYRLKKPIKILGFIDDPYSSYTRGIPYLWSFDGAFYISPSYFNGISFKENLSNWSGGKPSKWWPLIPRPHVKPESTDEGFFANRSTSLCYVGNHNGNKLDKIIRLKKEFGTDFRLHGRWPLKGYSGLMRVISGKKPFTHRVTPLSDADRLKLYWDTKIGFNMHVSNESFETGNMRMYEVPAHGAMLLCDKADLDMHEEIFVSGKEAVYYDTLDEAIDMIRYYSNPQNENERISISKAGYNKFWKVYEWEKNLCDFLDWAVNIRKNEF